MENRIIKEKNIRLVVTDLDDTLLSPDKEISEEAAEIIDGLEERGIKFTFITGRPPYAIERFAEKVRITAPVVACNGAMLVDRAAGTVFPQAALNPGPLLEILKDASGQGHTVLVLAGQTEYTLGETAWTRKRKEAGRELPVARIENLLSAGDIYKVNIMEEKDAPPFDGILARILERKDDYSVSVYGKSGCEIVAKGVNKRTGLLKLCEQCGIPPESVLAIGDNENDIEMIRAAGTGAAVENAVKRVKESADYICKNSYTDGVIEAILKFTRQEKR